MAYLPYITSSLINGEVAVVVEWAVGRWVVDVSATTTASERHVLPTLADVRNTSKMARKYSIKPTPVARVVCSPHQVMETEMLLASVF